MPNLTSTDPLTVTRIDHGDPPLSASSGYDSIRQSSPVPVSPSLLRAPIGSLSLLSHDNVGHIGVSSFRFPGVRTFPPAPPPPPLPFIAVQPASLAPPCALPPITSRPILCSLVPSPVTVGSPIGHLQPLTSSPVRNTLQTAFVPPVFPWYPPGEDEKKWTHLGNDFQNFQTAQTKMLWRRILLKKKKLQTLTLNLDEPSNSLADFQ